MAKIIPSPPPESKPVREFSPGTLFTMNEVPGVFIRLDEGRYARLNSGVIVRQLDLRGYLFKGQVTLENE